MTSVTVRLTDRELKMLKARNGRKGCVRGSEGLDYAGKSQAFGCAAARGAERVIEGRDCRQRATLPKRP